MQGWIVCVHHKSAPSQTEDRNKCKESATVHNINLTLLQKLLGQFFKGIFKSSNHLCILIR